MRLFKDRRYVIGAVAGFIYGVSIRLIEYLNRLHYRPFAATALWVMTCGFLCGVPFAIGWLGEAAAMRDDEAHYARWILSPWIPLLLSDLILAITNIEGSICIIFSLPITFAFGSLGGIAGGLYYRYKSGRRTNSVLCAAILPVLASGVEVALQPPTRIATAGTSIVIHADATAVWNKIKTVPTIRPDEIKPSWSHRIGFPLPIAATLDHEGIGGVRNASFQGNLVFIERVNDWQPNHQLGFTIKADTANIPPTTLDEHVTIGGRYFDVLDGQYRLEPIGKGDIRLHLVSHQRLSTDFNAYAALWTTSIMRDLQNSILQVIKHRCEHPSPTT